MDSHKKPKAPPAPSPVRRVACAAFSGRVPQERLDQGVAFLKAAGLEVQVFMPSTAREYLAGSDADRARCLVDAACWAREGRGEGLVMAIRGGYGAARALVDGGFCAPASRLLGFSDVSALFPHLAGACGWECWHGPNVCTLTQLDSASQQAFLDLLLGQRPPVPTLAGLQPLAPGQAQGPLLILNLSVLLSILGTPLAPPLEGVLLALEDTNEAPYRLDRLFWQLLHHREAQGIAGLLLGDLGVPLSADLKTLLLAQAEKRGIPMVAGLPIGHGPENMPFQQLALASLDALSGRLSSPA
jgi:muramoyltetrapeptide carboxypeptidase